MAEYAVHLLIRLGRLVIHIAVRQIRSDARILVQGQCCHRYSILTLNSTLNKTQCARPCLSRKDWIN